MQVVQAGSHTLIVLEYDLEFLTTLIKQAGFEYRMEETTRGLLFDLMAKDREAPLLLFDASDPGNLGWFSRCQFYVDGNNGSVLQTPMQIANQRDAAGHAVLQGVRVQLAKEIPQSFRMPGKQAVTEQGIYAVFYNFLVALLNVGVGVCGGSLVKPLAGRTENIGTRN